MNLRSFALPILILTLAGSAHAVSFRDYYHGNQALGIPSHEKEINDAVKSKKYLILRKANLTDLDGLDEIPGIEELTALQVDDNKIATLPEFIGTLPKLTYLCARHNKIETLPASFSNLTNLLLSSNKLTDFPACILSMLNLARLELSFNQIEDIPERIAALTQLTSLELTGNRITTIPTGLLNLPKLRSLSAQQQDSRNP